MSLLDLPAESSCKQPRLRKEAIPLYINMGLNRRPD